MTTPRIIPQSFRRFATLFVLAALVVLVVVSYVSWARVEVVLIPARRPIDFTFAVRVGPDQVVAEDVITGGVYVAEQSKSVTVPATGKQDLAIAPGSKTPVGAVTLYNKGAVAQTLIATTRLAFADKADVVVARIDGAVVIPAGGSAVANVYTQSPEAFTTITTGRLIMPGLRQGLWETVYAEITSPLQVTSSKTIVSEDDVQRAQQDLTDQLNAAILTAAEAVIPPDRRSWPRLVTTTQGQQTITGKAGDAVSAVTASASAQGTIVVFEPAQLTAVAMRKLQTVAGISTDGLVLTMDDFSYVVEEVKQEQGTAVLTVTIATEAPKFSMEQITDTQPLVGKSQEEIRQYFGQFKDISGVEVHFFPAWIKNAPVMPDRINVRVNF